LTVPGIGYFTRQRIHQLFKTIGTGGLVSREHCRIECDRGKFSLNDNSANGSYVTHNVTELIIHQERVPLPGEGYISPGIPAAANMDFFDPVFD